MPIPHCPLPIAYSPLPIAHCPLPIAHSLASLKWIFLIEPLQYGFMQRSLIVAVVVGIICAVVGTYLMVQRLALLGDAISHSVLPGLAIAFIFDWNIFTGAFIAGLLSTILINVIRNNSQIKEDAAMGIVFFRLFCLGNYPHYHCAEG